MGPEYQPPHVRTVHSAALDSVGHTMEMDENRDKKCFTMLTMLLQQYCIASFDKFLILTVSRNSCSFQFHSSNMAL